MSQLPKGWVEKRVGDVAQLINGDRGKNYPSQDEQLDKGYCLFLNTPNVKHGRFNFTFKKFITKEQHQLLRNGKLEANDIVVTIRGTLGNCAVYTDEIEHKVIRINSAMMIVRPSDCIQPWYLTRILSSSTFLEWAQKNHRGSAQPHLRAADIKEYKICFPGLAEQTRIVEKLDEVLAQVDTIKARLDGIPAILKRFRQSVLAAAVSGKLTEEWRGGQSLNAAAELIKLFETRKDICSRLGKKDKELKRVTNSEIKEEIPKSWVYSTLDPFLDVERAGMKTGPFGSLLKKHEHLHEGIPVLGIENISSGTFLAGSKIHISVEKAEELSTYDIIGGDLIISRSGTVGDICVVPDTLGTLRFSTNLMRVSFLQNSIDSRYFCFLFLGSRYVLRQVSSLCKGSTRDFLNQKILGSMYYPIPPLAEQKEIVRLVDQYFAFADSIEAQVKKAQARVDKLTQSILAKAFRGELVAQDPNDEPADKLLERIAAARAEAEALAKAAKKAGAAKKKVAKSA